MAHNAIDPECPPDPAELAIVAIAHWCQIFHGLIAPAEPGAEPGVYPDDYLWPGAVPDTLEDLNDDTVPRPFRAPTFDPLTRAARLLGDS